MKILIKSTANTEIIKISIRKGGGMEDEGDCE